MNENVVSGRKLLRSDGADDAGNESRTGLSVSITERLKSLFKSSNVTPEKLQSWLNSEKPADTVFMRMHLHKADDWVLQAPQFTIPTLTRQLGDDKLYRVIKSAKMIPQTKNIATRLETELVQYWVTIRKDPDEVFRLNFSEWVSYVDDVNAKNPENPIGGSKNERNDENKVEDDMAQVWLNSRKAPEDILLKLKLGDTMERILESPRLNTWTKYIDAYNSRYRGGETSMIEVLTRKFRDKRVAEAINAAKTSEDTTKNIALKLESAQLEMWLRDGKSTDDIYELLELSIWRSDFSHNPLLETWVSYMDTVVTNSPSKMSTLFSTLESRFTDRPLLQILEKATKFSSMESAATKLQIAKMQSIFESKMSPKDSFYLLGLDTVGDSVLSSHVLKRWKEYVKSFNKANPKKVESWFEPLRINYQHIERMIETAKQNPRTVGIGTEAESALHKHWLDRGKSPGTVFRDIFREKPTEHLLTIPKFGLWTQYLETFNKRYPKNKTTIAAKNDRSKDKQARDLKDAMVARWIDSDEKLTDLQRRFSHVKDADELIQQFKKLKKIP
ncbi:hypothetical protein GN958_ATG04628 [Phytophthora infestans]|uniref:RxLR effector protein n=1 Tax=Phytophthora infestans TaxID=4787 RepID=A0A8S9V0P3_PHYIN|nr:hypothetical protein GN958_ATG04628 [Phytophthora infestans]